MLTELYLETSNTFLKVCCQLIAFSILLGAFSVCFLGCGSYDFCGGTFLFGCFILFFKFFWSESKGFSKVLPKIRYKFQYLKIQF